MILLLLFSYFITVELSPIKPSVCEIIVWIWAATLWLDEFRQVEI